VLLEEGFEVRSRQFRTRDDHGPDPEFATSTIIEARCVAGPADPDHRKGATGRISADPWGGRTALNLAMATPIGDRQPSSGFGVELIGADAAAIRRAEDREEFRRTMNAAGLRVPWSITVESLGEVEAALADGRISLPAIVRPAFTMGGEGGGVGGSETELRQVVSEGLAASPINQVLVEESVLGWGEFELEVMRDRNDKRG